MMQHVLVLQVLGEHRDYVNEVCFHPDKGDLIASVSDDHTCCVWSLEGSQVACFPLGAPGMAVSWHVEEPAKVVPMHVFDRFCTICQSHLKNTCTLHSRCFLSECVYLTTMLSLVPLYMYLTDCIISCDSSYLHQSNVYVSHLLYCTLK